MTLALPCVMLMCVVLMKIIGSLAFVAHPYPPALSTPAGAEREPNSPIWPTLLTEGLPAVGPWANFQFIGVRVQLITALPPAP